MILRSLKLENIRSYTAGTVEFPEQSTVLSGDIGSGKSTILLAIEFALFGLGNLSGSQLLRHGEKQGSVELGCTIATQPGKEMNVLIKRGLRRTKDSVQQDAGWIALKHEQGGWTKTEATPVELKTKILDLMGYPAELLTKSKTHLYRFTVYTPQEQMKQILLGNSDDRLDTIRKIFGIDTYARVQANAALVGKELRSKIKQESIRAEGIDEDKEKQYEERVRMDQITLRRDSEEHERRQLNARAAAVKQQHDELMARQMEAHRLAQQRAVCQAHIQEKKQHANRCGEELKNLHGVREKFQQGISITKTVEPRAALEQQRATLARRHTEAMAQFSVLVGREQQLIADISRRKTMVDQLIRLHHCPMCQQGVSDEHKQSMVQREMPFVQQAEQELGTLREQKQQHDGLFKQLEQDEHALRDREREAVMAETTLLRLQDLDHQRVERERMLQQLTASLQELNDEEQKLGERLQAYAGIPEQFTAVQKELEEARLQERKCAIACAEVQKEIDHTNVQLRVLEETIKQKEGLRKKLHRISQLETWLNGHLIRVAGLIEKEVLRTVYVQFDELFKNWFSMLVEDELLQARLGDDFSVVVEQNGYETTVENLSGGEKTAVALAYRLALNKVINDIVSTIRTKNLLILDEPTDGFSAHQLDKVRTVLRELNAQQIILVSHEQKIESFVDHVIRIEKRGHESVVVG